MAVDASFGLARSPFTGGANSALFFEGEAQRRALAHLRYGIKQGEGIVIITGDAGTGKTAVVQRLTRIADLGRALILLSARDLDTEQLEDTLAQSLRRLQTDEIARDLMGTLRALKEAGKLVSLAIDDAENLSDRALEKVRRLTNLFHDGEALLQVALIGRTPLRAVLYRSDMEQLRQRIIASYHLPPLTAAEAARFVEESILAAGGDPARLFTVDGRAALIRRGEGLPGRLCQIGAAAMARAAAAGRSVVDAGDVDAAEPGEVQITEAAAPAASRTRLPNSVEPATINAAIEKLNAPTAPEKAAPERPAAMAPAPVATAPVNGPAAPATVPAAPVAPARPPLSPQEWMFAQKRVASVATNAAAAPIVPAPVAVAPAPAAAVVAAPAVPTPIATIAAAPVPDVVGDVWDPATPMDEAEAARLDDVTLPTHTDGAMAGPRAELEDFLRDTGIALDRLRANLKTLRTEVDRLDARRRTTREKIGARIESLRPQLDGIISE